MARGRLEELARKKRPPVGTGERFEQLSGKLAHRKGVRDPKALAAAIGRRKFGAAKMAAMAAAGRKKG
jgi:hypothetical protein